MQGPLRAEVNSQLARLDIALRIRIQTFITSFHGMFRGAGPPSGPHPFRYALGSNQGTEGLRR